MDLYKVAFLLGAFICTGLEAQLQNYPGGNQYLTCVSGNGAAYRGTVGVTLSGRICQEWAAQRSHRSDMSPMMYPYAGLVKNYCRNPNNDLRPWCYTTDPFVHWEYCNLPFCNRILPPGECMHCNGENYRGTISWTRNHVTCQRWDSQYPHRHWTKETYGGQNLEGNFCRNPNKDEAPWCYTTDPKKRWDYCNIPRCSSPPPVIKPELICMTGNGKDYRGTWSVTQNGYPCKRWSETPYKPERFPCSDLRHNYCRNVLGRASKPWCYIGNNMWDYCYVPECIVNIYQGLPRISDLDFFDLKNLN